MRVTKSSKCHVAEESRKAGRATTDRVKPGALQQFGVPLADFDNRQHLVVQWHAVCIHVLPGSTYSIVSAQQARDCAADRSRRIALVSTQPDAREIAEQM